MIGGIFSRTAATPQVVQREYLQRIFGDLHSPRQVIRHDAIGNDTQAMPFANRVERGLQSSGQNRALEQCLPICREQRQVMPRTRGTANGFPIGNLT